MLLVSHEGTFATGSEEAGLQEHSKAAGFPLFQCLATALSTGVYRYSNRKKTFCVSYPLILSDFFPLLSQNLNKNRNMLKHH